MNAMTDTETLLAAQLDDILSRWHHWASNARIVKGFASRALVCGDFKVSRQYDDTNGALDGDLEDSTMKAVDFQVNEMLDPWRTAIHCNARNICAGVSVWSSPRLPQDKDARAAVVVVARGMLHKRLTAAGVL